MMECCICTADVEDKGILMREPSSELKFLRVECTLTAILHDQAEVVCHWGITPLEELEEAEC